MGLKYSRQISNHCGVFVLLLKSELRSNNDRLGFGSGRCQFFAQGLIVLQRERIGRTALEHLVKLGQRFGVTLLIGQRQAEIQPAFDQLRRLAHDFAELAFRLGLPAAAEQFPATEKMRLHQVGRELGQFAKTFRRFVMTARRRQALPQVNAQGQVQRT